MKALSKTVSPKKEKESSGLTVVSTVPAWKQNMTPTDLSDSIDESDTDSALNTFAILSALYAQVGISRKRLEYSYLVLPCSYETFILITTADAVIKINTSNYQVDIICQFKDFLDMDISKRHKDNLVQVARSGAFDYSYNRVSCTVLLS